MSLDKALNEDRKFASLPFSNWWPLGVGAAVGLGIRLLYSGQPGGPWSAMATGFIYFAPAIVAAITVYCAERVSRRTWGYYFSAGLLANMIFVVGTLLIMIEGLICAVIIAPLFGVLGGLAGLIMGALCRLLIRPRRALYGFALLPLMTSAFEPGVPPGERIGTVQRTILVDARPEIVWRSLLDVPSVAPAEIEEAWLFRIGVPLTRSGRLEETPQGRVRRVAMGKNIHFDEVITEWDEPRALRWTYRYASDSFPPYALDEHVVLGGHYFDIRDTAYRLEREGDQTRLTVSMQYRVSTRFNWYADPVAEALLANLARVNLRFYQRRAEGAAG